MDLGIFVSPPGAARLGCSGLYIRRADCIAQTLPSGGGGGGDLSPLRTRSAARRLTGTLAPARPSPRLRLRLRPRTEAEGGTGGSSRAKDGAPNSPLLSFSPLPRVGWKGPGRLRRHPGVSPSQSRILPTPALPTRPEERPAQAR